MQTLKKGNFHRILSATKAVIIPTPINWNSMSARLKAFLDRTTGMENLYHIHKPGLTGGEIAWILSADMRTAPP